LYSPEQQGGEGGRESETEIFITVTNVMTKAMWTTATVKDAYSTSNYSQI